MIIHNPACTHLDVIFSSADAYWFDLGEGAETEGLIIENQLATTYSSIGKKDIDKWPYIYHDLIRIICESEIISQESTSCNEFTWINGDTYFESGEYEYHEDNGYICPTIYQLNLNIDCPDTWDCFNHECINPENGSGLYETLEDCQNNCNTCTVEYQSGYNDGVVSVDITIDNQEAFEAGVASVQCPDCSENCPGDLDNDYQISTSDLLLFLAQFGSICEN